MDNTITLPVGTVEVLTREIPSLIADAITPEERASVCCITSVKKIAIFPCADDGTAHDAFPKEQQLTFNESASLSKAFRQSGLLSLTEVTEKKETSLSEWGLYEEAVKNHLPKWNWKLKPHSKTVLEIRADQHSEYLEEAIENGNAVVRDLISHIPQRHAVGLTTLEKAYMTVSDFTEYAAKFNLEVTVGEIKDGQHLPQYNGSKANDAPPGITQGMVTITKLAIKAAWEIEQATGKKASAKSVIQRLQEWVASEQYAELIRTIPHGIVWMTSIPDEKTYDIDACRATLKSWNKSRAQQEAKDSNQKLSTPEKTQ